MIRKVKQVRPLYGNKRIFVNDQLTPKTAALFKAAKQRREEESIKFVWLRNGDLFARAEENQKAVKILEENDRENVCSQK